MACGMCIPASIATAQAEKDNGRWGNGPPCIDNGKQGGERGPVSLDDPISLASGDYVLRQTDLFMPGRGLSFSFERTYHSRSGFYSNSFDFSDEIGMNWDHSYNLRVKLDSTIETWIANRNGTPGNIQTNKPIAFFDGKGRCYDFFLIGEDTSAPSGYRWFEFGSHGFDSVLRLEVDLSTTDPVHLIKMINGDNEVTTFSSEVIDLVGFDTTSSDAWRVTEIRDRNDNTLTFEYEPRNTSPGAADRLSKITDPLGNEFTFDYANAPGAPFAGDADAEELIWKVTDSTANRVVTYGYQVRTDSIGDRFELTSVQLPDVGSAGGTLDLPSQHDDAITVGELADRRVWRFTYTDFVQEGDGGTMTPFWAGQIRQVIDPVGNIVTENIYEAPYVNQGSVLKRDRIVESRVRTQFEGRPPESAQIADPPGVDSPADLAFEGRRYDYFVLNTQSGNRLNAADGTNKPYTVFVIDRAGRYHQLDYSGIGGGPQNGEAGPLWANTADSGQDASITARRLLRRQDIPNGVSGARNPNFPGITSLPWSTDAGGWEAWVEANNPGLDAPSAVVQDFDYDLNWQETMNTRTVSDGMGGTDLLTTEMVTQKSMDANEDPRGSRAIETRKRIFDPTPGSPGDETELVESFEHRFSFSGAGAGTGCCNSSFMTRYVDAEGNVTLYRYDVDGNRVGVYRGIFDEANPTTPQLTDWYLNGAQPPAGDITTAKDLAASWVEMDYNTSGQVTETRTALRDGTTVEVRTDRFEYGTTSGMSDFGRLTKKIEAFGSSVERETLYEYDDAGNVTKLTDPSGDYAVMSYDESNRLIRTERWGEYDIDGAGPTAPSIYMLSAMDFYRDANGNIVREEIANLDDTLTPGFQNETITTLREYDALNRLRFEAREIGAVEDAPITILNVTGSSTYYDTSLDDEGGRIDVQTLIGNADWAVTETRYDVNGEISDVLYPLAVDGTEPTNRVAFEHDFRNRLVRRYDGATFSGTGFNITVEGLLETAYEYDEQDRMIATTIDPDTSNSRRTEYFYDGFNRLDLVLDPMGNATRYTYDGNDNTKSVRVEGQLADTATGTNDRLMSFMEYEYDELDRVVMEKTGVWNSDPDSLVTTDLLNPTMDLQTVKYEYNLDSTVASVIYPAGANPTSENASGTVATMVNEYDDLSRRVRSYFVDDQPSPAKIGTESVVVYDEDSRVTEQTEIDHDDGSTSTRSFETKYFYDGLDRVTEIHGRAHEASVADRNVTRMRYDSRSNVVRTEQDVTPRVLDSVGNLDSSVSSRTQVTIQQYDGLSRETLSAQLIGTDPATIDAATYDFSTATGSDVITRSVYDKSSRMTQLIAVGGPNATDQVTEYEYDGINRRTKTIMPDDSESTTTYTTFGTVESTTDARGVVVEYAETDMGGFTDTTFYDKNNRVTKRVINDGANAIPGSTEERFTYDSLGRITSAINDETLIERTYDSRSNIVIETANAFKDPAVTGFPAVTDFLSAGDRETTYKYNVAGRLVETDYAGGRTITHEYDLLNRRIGIDEIVLTGSPPTPSTIELIDYSYYGTGRLDEMTRLPGDPTATPPIPDGITTSFSYGGTVLGTALGGDQSFGQMIEINHPGVLDIRLSFDEAGNKTLQNTRPDGYTDEYRVRNFEYDTANRLVQSEAWNPPTLGSGGPNLPLGETGYTLGMVHNRTEVTSSQSYNGAPTGTGYVLDSDSSSANPYDATASAQDDVVNQYSVTPPPIIDGTATTKAMAHIYDENGNLTMSVEADFVRTDIDGDGTVDSTDQGQWIAWYTSPSGSPDRENADYNGDGIVNLQDLQAFSNSYNDYSGGRSPYLVTYSYDFRNQLVQAIVLNRPESTEAEITLDFVYDAFNRRLIRAVDRDQDDTTATTAGDKVIEYTYGGMGAWQILEERETTGLAASASTGVTRSYVYGLSIDDLVTYQVHSSGMDYFLHQDDQSTVHAVSDEMGNVVERYEYDDYGTATVWSGNYGVSSDRSFIGNTRMFTGRLLEPEILTYQYRHRYMSPGLGKFLQRDLLAFVDGMSMVQYVSANPLSRVDILGLFGTSPNSYIPFTPGAPGRWILRRPLLPVREGPLSEPFFYSPHPMGPVMIPNPLAMLPYKDDGPLSPGNYEFEHEHLWWPDHDNWGFFDDGRVKRDGEYIEGEVPERFDDYYRDGEYFPNEEAFDQAYNKCKNRFDSREPYCLIPGFGHPGGNCQSFADCVRYEYEQINGSGGITPCDRKDYSGPIIPAIEMFKILYRGVREGLLWN
ncbi:MAG: RHS repeat-associated core domain-containing protein [Planctomycetota bacterium]